MVDQDLSSVVDQFLSSAVDQGLSSAVDQFLSSVEVDQCGGSGRCGSVRSGPEPGGNGRVRRLTVKYPELAELPGRIRSSQRLQARLDLEVRRISIQLAGMRRDLEAYARR